MVQTSSRYLSLIMLACLTCLPASTPAGAAPLMKPASGNIALRPISTLDGYTAERVDVELEMIEDQHREHFGLPGRFAIPRETFISPETDGVWESLDQSTLLWRYRVSSPGALSLNMGFSRFHLPAGAHMIIFNPDADIADQRYDADDNKPHGQLWTPILLHDELVIEIVVPVKERDNLDVLLSSVNVGYRDLSPQTSEKSGDCNIDVACAEGDPWRDEIQSVAVISLTGSTHCTGFMINNTAEDATPYFMTAEHCNVNIATAPSLVASWNHQSVNCGDHSGGSLSQNQTGAIWRAGNSDSDFTLVEMDDLPDPDWKVSYAGWNRSSNNPTSAVAIHHPSTDEKSISFENDACTTTTYQFNESPGDGTHIRVIDWDLGTTETGSSGSPLFDQNHLVVGQLHGGWAACGNDLSDWYGRFSVSWNNGLSASERLRDWLDPLSTGQLTLETLLPYVDGLTVAPAGETLVQGDSGGPFAPSVIEYQLSNNFTEPFTYDVSTETPWLEIVGGSGSLASNETVTINVNIGNTATTMAKGLYSGEIFFRNMDQPGLESKRDIRMLIGIPKPIATWNMDDDPGWQTEGDWLYGPATTGPVDYGNPDPDTAATGQNVYGFAPGDSYPADMPRYHLTTDAIDCTNMVYTHLEFMRWLNVERPAYDQASVSISTDGHAFVPIWENVEEITDDAWMPQAFDISAFADGQDQVWLRWTMGVTDGSWEYSGWNLDDVVITAVNTSLKSNKTMVGQILTMTGTTPNPFNPSTRLSFTIAEGAVTRLEVIDIRGRLVRVLRDEFLQPGTYQATWNGRDDQGRAVSSGSYFFRLNSDRQTLVRKAVLVR
jgi:trypsin-like peptidase/flagellar hook capping protein FlgD